MDEKKHLENIEPLEESDLKEELEHELLTKDKGELESLNRKVHEGGEAELPPKEPLEIEDQPSHYD